jgi:hypothetical protein
MRQPFSMPPQVVRLCLLALGIVITYSIARYFLTPPSFGEYGWYRGDALVELSEREPVYAGKQACGECHAEQVQKLQKDQHKTLTCEACHGPGAAHAGNPDIKIDKSSYGVCLRCHEANPSRPKWHKQVVSKTHYRETKPGAKPSLCTDCHVPHAPSEVP